MSIAKLINRKTSGKVSVVDIIDKQLRNREYFDIRKVKKAAKELHEYLEDDDVTTDELNKHFFALWFVFFADHKRTLGCLHPSQLRDGCDRMQVLELLEYEQDDEKRSIEGKTQRIFDIGTFVHLYIQTLLYFAGVLIKSEARVKNRKKRLSGSADGIIMINGIKYLLEIKTITQSMFGLIKRFPLPKHIFQASIYAKELGIEKMCFLYVNKDTLDIQEHLVDVTEDNKRIIDEQIDYLNECADDEKLPKRICKDINDPKGKYCPYKNACFGLTHKLK